MKKLSISLLFLVLIGISSSYAQKYIDRTGHASFYSEAPIENIEAHNEQVLSLLDLSNGDIVASMLMKSFKFEKSLMQEHFNEKYVESEKYPKATFKGKLKDIKKLDLTKSGTYELEVDGEIALHGEKQPLKSVVKFEVKDGVLSGSSVFNLAVKDFKIPIPTLVIKNIAEVVEVRVSFNYQPSK